MKKVFTYLLFSLLLLTPLFSALAVDVGDAAPDFRLPNLEGKEVSLSDFKGRPVLLKLATTWCPSCKEQSQEIAAVSDFLAANNVAVIEVYIQDSEKMVREYVGKAPQAKNHYVLLDNGSVVKAYNLYVIPRTLLLDRELKVVRDGNLMTGSEIKKQLEKVLPH